MKSSILVLALLWLAHCSRASQEASDVDVVVPDGVVPGTGADVVSESDAPQESKELWVSDPYETMPIPPIMVDFTPLDLSTAVRGIEIQLHVGLSGRSVPEDLLHELGARLSLSTTPTSVSSEFLMIPFDVNVHAADPLGADRTDRKVSLLPVQSLGSDWHEVAIDLSGLEDVEPLLRLVELEEGVFGTRFHPDSQPVLRLIRICSDQQREEGLTIIVEFSEPVNFVPKPSTVEASPIDIEVGGIPCHLQPNLQDFESDQYASKFYFQCMPGVESEQGSFLLRLSRPLYAQSGEVLSEYGTTQPLSVIAFELTETRGESECRFWQPP